ncbi:tripartite tricarboxylate transporter TctB family protein [Oricola indica]|uniref:tripartite tricarboxylate transporter TctB family protein n=1 Tax=Oricola indica TaxID=2872591 RepID=UPI003CCBBE61
MFSKNPLKGYLDLIIAIVAIPLALWLFIIAPQEAPGLYDDGIQPWLFPRVVLLFSMILCVLLAAFWLKRRISGDEIHEFPVAEDDEAPTQRDALLNAIVPIALIVLYVIGTIWIGYIYATAIVAVLYMLYLGASVWMTFLVTAGLTAVLYFVFGDMLNIPLPLGRLFQ